MGSELIVFEKEVEAYMPRWEDVLQASGVPVATFMRSVVISCERNPALLQANRQTLLLAGTSLAVLGLEADGVTGQGFLVSFRGRVQPLVGYKGFNTQAGRSGMMLLGEAVHRNDEFDYELGTRPWVHHKPVLENRGPIVAAWSQLTHSSIPPSTPTILGLEELEEIMKRSPAARKGDGPWRDNSIGYSAMCAKSAKRRQARSVPLNLGIGARQMLLAAAMEEKAEMTGEAAYLTPDGALLGSDGRSTPEPVPIAPPDENASKVLDVPPLEVHLADGSKRSFTVIDDWKTFMIRGITTIQDPVKLNAFEERNNNQMAAVANFPGWTGAAEEIENAFAARKKELGND